MSFELDHVSTPIRQNLGSTDLLKLIESCSV